MNVVVHRTYNEDEGTYVRYHPKIDTITVSNEDGYDTSHSPSFSCWMVPGTVDPMED